MKCIIWHDNIEMDAFLNGLLLIDYEFVKTYNFTPQLSTWPAP